MDDPAPPLIGLRPDLEGATEEQRHVVERIAAGPRGSVPSPFLAMLDAPQLAMAIQEVGTVLRFASTLSDALREVAILATAGAVRCGYEWNYHAPIAATAGVPAEVLAATRPGARSDDIAEPAATAIALCREVVATGEASAPLLSAAVERLGRTGATELVAIAGYYALLANFIKSGGHDEAFRPA